MADKKAAVAMVAILFLVAAGQAHADLKEYVGIIRPELNEKTKRMFQDLSDYFKSKGQQGEADYFASWAQGAWHGSGWVLIDEDGSNYIITNRHVAQQAERIDFQLEQPDGSMKSYDNCPILYIDNDVDLAVAQFPEGKKVYDRGFSLNMEIQPDGQEVWSAGFPGLLGQAGWQFSRGDITNSRARVPQLIDPKISHVIQHSASIDPGNSGGPLLLKNPRSPLGYDVVGVNTWSIRNRQNTFFSIPSKAVRMILDKAKAARDMKADQEKLKARLVKNCKILAAELGSESRDYDRLMKFISYAFVGNLGWSCWNADVATMSSAQDRSESQKRFFDEPVETMRYSIFRVFLAEMLLRSDNDLSTLEFREINAADEEKVGEGQAIRTIFTVRDERIEAKWIFEYGDWRISYVTMKRFAELLGGVVAGTGAETRFPKASMKIDGDFQDWSELPVAFTGSGGSTGLSIGKVYLAVDQERFYMRFDVGDATPSSFLHPHNFDVRHNSSYGLDIENGKNKVVLQVNYLSSGRRSNRWLVQVGRVDNGRWTLLDESAYCALKGSSLEASFPLAKIKTNLGLPDTGGSCKISARTGYSDSQGKWVEGAGESTAAKAFAF